ncbi:hypothetical protein B0H15DRAFT_942552 [Mycena belliarum]|uniref:Uncharacterized protein n=1 Tax=Mycena belliarum TaxID=1033014 RepID=A0AAD6XVT0_9AGAR|nr:hypothetical protein B0H15DRAFT_942552 [Mycena belliae]
MAKRTTPETHTGHCFPLETRSFGDARDWSPDDERQPASDGLLQPAAAWVQPGSHATLPPSRAVRPAVRTRPDLRSVSASLPPGRFGSRFLPARSRCEPSTVESVPDLFRGLERPEHMLYILLWVPWRALPPATSFHLAPSPHCSLCDTPQLVPHVPSSPAPATASNASHSSSASARPASPSGYSSLKSGPRPVFDFVRDTGRLPRYVL